MPENIKEDNASSFIIGLSEMIQTESRNHPSSLAQSIDKRIELMDDALSLRHSPYGRFYIEDYARNDQNPMFNRVVAVYLAMTGREAASTLVPLFKQAGIAAAKTPEDRIAVEFFVKHELAKGADLRVARGVGLANLATALKIDAPNAAP